MERYGKESFYSRLVSLLIAPHPLSRKALGQGIHNASSVRSFRCLSSMNPLSQRPKPAQYFEAKKEKKKMTLSVFMTYSSTQAFKSLIPAAALL